MAQTNTQTKGTAINPILLLELFGVIVGGILVYKFLHKMNIFGTSEDTKNARLLASDISLSQNTVNALNTIDNEFRDAVKKEVVSKYGAKATPENVKDEVKSLLPNLPNFGKRVLEIWKSYNRFLSNDTAPIFDVIKSLKSKFEVNAFATYYGAFSRNPANKSSIPKASLAGDFYEVLNNLMHDSDMARLREVINSKPLI